MHSKQTAGLLLFIGASQFFISMLIAEALYPNYSIAKNMISDLGVGPTAPIFSGSIIILGGLILAALSRLYKDQENIWFTALMCVTGIGAMGVGFFNEDMHPFHEIFAGITFIFGGAGIIYSSKVIRSPLSIVAIVLGCITLVFLVLFLLKLYLGLGPGGTERMIVYPIILWGLGAGGYLMASQDVKT